jgi:hypothetical protein
MVATLPLILQPRILLGMDGHNDNDDEPNIAMNTKIAQKNGQRPADTASKDCSRNGSQQ